MAAPFHLSTLVVRRPPPGTAADTAFYKNGVIRGGGGAFDVDVEFGEIGARFPTDTSAGGGFLEGDIIELIGYERALPDIELEEVNEYMRMRYPGLLP